MLVFVVPLQSKSVSKSWKVVSQLFERSMQSACQQTSPHFQVIVVCNEKPDTTFEHPKLSYLEVDFPVPDINSGTPKDILNQKRTDRGRKMLRGLVAAQDFNPTHTMLLDADDLVSKRLAEFVGQHPQANGWFFNKGYRYTPGDYWIYRKSNGFHTMCGSCNILRNDLNKIPENPQYNRGYGYYKFYIDHAKIVSVLAEEGKYLRPLPFLGSVYIVKTGENTYFNSSRLYQGIGRYLNYRLVTPFLKREFRL